MENINVDEGEVEDTSVEDINVDKGGMADDTRVEDINVEEG